MPSDGTRLIAIDQGPAFALTSPGTFAAAANYAAPDANQIAIADVNGDGFLDIVVATGFSQIVKNGVITNNPGVLLQNAGSPGTFGSLQDLP